MIGVWVGSIIELVLGRCWELHFCEDKARVEPSGLPNFLWSF